MYRNWSYRVCCVCQILFSVMTFLQTVILQLHLITLVEQTMYTSPLTNFTFSNVVKFFFHIKTVLQQFRHFLRSTCNRELISETRLILMYMHLWLYYSYIEYLCMFVDECPKGHSQAAVTSGTAVMCSALWVPHAYDGRNTSAPSQGQVLHNHPPRTQ